MIFDGSEAARPGALPPEAREQAVAIGAKALLAQSAVSAEAPPARRACGLRYVEDHCAAVEARPGSAS